MSTKYSVDDRLLDDIAISKHATWRFRERTPHDCDIRPRDAWRLGEDIKHPSVVQSDNETEPPDRARVYRHGDEWMIIFFVDAAQGESTSPKHKSQLVVTVLSLREVNHPPSRSYLHSHGPHGGVDG
jgi:hypothetical protein